MTNYKDIWDSLNRESSLSKANKVIYRKIRSEGKPIFLASDVEKGLRFLFAEISADEKIVPAELPGFRGLDIGIVETDIGGIRNGRFLKLSQVTLNSSEIFEYMISDICDKISGLTNEQAVILALRRALKEWQIFFEKKQDRLLTPTQQKGLFGELSFLNDYPLKKYPPHEAVTSWTGSDRTNHDFQFHTTGVEVKVYISEKLTR